ncbi:HNH endonuclease [Candidatus Saccharibacteria bacterium]|nr:HNH endonuclease [Candidatus Saccharibacteria bacterium]
MGNYRLHRVAVVIILLVFAAIPISQSTWQLPNLNELIQANITPTTSVTAELKNLIVKGRAPKTGYERSKFGDGWQTVAGCTTRNRVLIRDLASVVIGDDCKVDSGILRDPYTGKTITFMRGETTSDDVQIDHVVALSNAWQTGAQQLDVIQRIKLANDPLNLLAVDGPANEAKSDSDAATWLPPNKVFRCAYVKRQVAVKSKYGLWVTLAERDAMATVLSRCPA